MMNDAAPQKPRRWVRVVFVLSLAMNLLVVGLVAGALLRYDKPHGRHSDRISMGLGSYIKALPETERKAVRAAAGERVKSRRAFVKAMRARRTELDVVITAEPFSPDALRQALADHREFAVSGTKDMHEAFAGMLTEMSVDERAAYFKRVGEIQAKRKHRREKKWRKD